MTNEIFYKTDNFYLSYAEKIDEFGQALDSLAAKLGGASPQDKPETALVIRNPAKMLGWSFYILYGDHRKAYLNLANHGLEACIKYFDDHIYLLGHSSEVPPDIY